MFLVRHAEPALTGVMLGSTDPPLAAGAQIPHVDAAIIYSSPMRRAMETAVRMGAPVEVVDDFREISFGVWDGRRWSEIEAKYPDLARRWIENWQQVTPPGAEPWLDFTARVTRAVERIKHGPQPAAIVAHAAVNAVILQLAGREYRGMEYGEVVEIEF